MSVISVVGIDVAKAHVDVCVLDANRDTPQFANDAEGHSALAATLQPLGVGLVAVGGYEAALICAQQAAGVRFEIRWALYMATLTATRRNPAIKASYQSLTAAGKLPKVALVACMRKLLTLLNAIVRTSTPWDKSLHRT